MKDIIYILEDEKNIAMLYIHAEKGTDYLSEYRKLIRSLKTKFFHKPVKRN
jgi:hypothetical protein